MLKTQDMLTLLLLEALVAGEATASPLCPTGMVLVEGGDGMIGRLNRLFGEEQVPPLEVDIEPFCIGELPFPGVEGDPWMLDGIEAADVWLWERLLHDYGRRFCTVEEHVWASASGTANNRFLRGNQRDQRCEQQLDVEQMSPLGSHPACVNELGLRDVGVSSSWVRSSPEVDLVRGAEWIRPFVVVGGTAREDTFYSPDNFGLHAHDPGNPPFSDDQLRICADLGEAEEAAWLDLTLAASLQGSFEGTLRWFDEQGVEAWGAAVVQPGWVFLRDERE